MTSLLIFIHLLFLKKVYIVITYLHVPVKGVLGSGRKGGVGVLGVGVVLPLGGLTMTGVGGVPPADGG